MTSAQDLLSRPAARVAEAVRQREATAREVVRAALDRLEADELNAVVETWPERALERARAMDEALEAGREVGPLAGVPVGIKANLCTDWGRTTCSSRTLEEYRSPFTATCVQRLESAGAIAVASLAMDEFAMGSSGEHAHGGPTKHPLHADRVPGGSSSGSAAAVGGRLVPLALGSDTGGSIRQPASFCGLVGLKPTYGRVSRSGLIAFASSLDQVGPLCRSVEDAALALDAISGHDPLDMTSAPMEPTRCYERLGEEPGAITIGLPSRLVEDICTNNEVRTRFAERAAALERCGAKLVEVELDHVPYAISAYYIVAPAEASSNLARYDGVRFGLRAEVADGEGVDAMFARSRAEGFGEEVQRRILLGTFVLSTGYHEAFYERALKVRRLIKRDYDEAFTKCDAVLMPTTPRPAFKQGEHRGDPLSMYLEDALTIGANMAGLPAISVPAGSVDRDGAALPIGMELAGPAFGEERLLRIAALLERA